MSARCDIEHGVLLRFVWPVQIDGIYVRSLRDWDTFAVRTSQIITGQNAASSKETADAVVDALSFGVRLTP